MGSKMQIILVLMTSLKVVNKVKFEAWKGMHVHFDMFCVCTLKITVTLIFILFFYFIFTILFEWIIMEMGKVCKKIANFEQKLNGV